MKFPLKIINLKRNTISLIRKWIKTKVLAHNPVKEVQHLCLHNILSNVKTENFGPILLYCLHIIFNCKFLTITLLSKQINYKLELFFETSIENTLKQTEICEPAQTTFKILWSLGPS